MYENKSQSKGCIANGQIAEDSLTFCSYYMEDIETRFNRPRPVRDDQKYIQHFGMSTIFPQLSKPASAAEITYMQKIRAHRYVLLNC